MSSFDPVFDPIVSNSAVFDPDAPIVSNPSMMSEFPEDAPIGASADAAEPVRRTTRASNSAAFDPDAPIVSKPSMMSEFPEDAPISASADAAEPVRRTTRATAPTVATSAMFDPDAPIVSKPSTMSEFPEDVPIGASAGTTEMPSEVAPEQEAVKDDRPLTERLDDKGWKVRKEAHEDLTQLFEAAGSGSADVFSEYAPRLVKIAKETNASALDSGLAAILAFCSAADSAGTVAEDISPWVIKSGFPGKPATAEKAKAIVLQLMTTGAEHTVVQALIGGLKDRKPKVPPACIECMTTGLRRFGIKKMPVPAIVGQLKALMDSTKADTREQATALTVELFRWVGKGPLEGCMSKLRSAQVTELEKAFESITPGQARPEADNAAGAKAAAGAAAGTKTSAGAAGAAGAAAAPAAPAASPGIDNREFVEPVDLLALLPKTAWKKLHTSAKWAERVQALNAVLEAVGPVPNLKAPGTEYAELVGQLKKLLKDSNMQVVCAAMGVVGALADGLRREFGMYAKGFFGDFLERFKDKKTATVTAVTAALNRMLKGSLAFEAVAAEVAAALNAKSNKVTQARANLHVFLCAFAQVQGPLGVPAAAATQLALAKLSAKCLTEDPDPKVGNAL